MRRFLAGATTGLLIGVVAGAGGAGLLGLGPPSPMARTGEGVRRGTGVAGDAAGPRTPSTNDSSRSRGAAERRPPARPERARVAPADRTPRSDPPAVSPAPQEAPRISTAELRRLLDGALRSGTPIGGDIPGLAGDLAGRADAQPLPLRLVELALAKAEGESDIAVNVAAALVRGISPDDAADALRAALDGNARLLWIALALAERAALADGFDAGALAAELLRHPSAHARSAGVNVSQWSETPPIDDLVRVATTDSDEDTRGWALSVLTSLATDSEDPATRERAVPIVLMTALEGSTEARTEAISRFEEIGPRAADTALKLLREGGLDEDLAYHAVRPVLQAGRITELLALGLDEPTASAIVWWLDEEEDGEDRLSSCLPCASQIYRSCDEEAAESFVYLLVNHQQFEAIERIAQSEPASRAKRRLLISQLSDGADLPEERFEEVEMHALRILARFVDPSRASTRQRLAIVRSAAWGEIAFYTQRGVLGAIAILQNVARTDPNSWVRGHAADAIESLRENLE